jgi:hypothetical protein
MSSAAWIAVSVAAISPILPPAEEDIAISVLDPALSGRFAEEIRLRSPQAQHGHREMQLAALVCAPAHLWLGN